MDEPRFGRLWRRRAFGLSRGASRRSHDRQDLPRIDLELLVKALHDLADRLGFRFGRRARIRLVRPEQSFKPIVVDPQLIRPTRMDARGLQRMLEAEMGRGPRPRDEPGGSPGGQEPVRRSG
jgi:hypothetical protein